MFQLTVSENLNNVVSDEALSLLGLDNQNVLSSVSFSDLLDHEEHIVSLLNNLVPGREGYDIKDLAQQKYWVSFSLWVLQERCFRR